MSELPPPPKMPAQAHILYTSDAEVRRVYKEAHPDVSNKELVSALSAQFKALPADEHKVFEDKAAELKSAYEKELAEYKKKYGDDAVTRYRQAHKPVKRGAKKAAPKKTAKGAKSHEESSSEEEE